MKKRVKMKAWRGWCYVLRGKVYVGSDGGVILKERPRPYDPICGIRIARVIVREVGRRKGKKA